MSQRKYIVDILKNMGLMGCKPAATPQPKGTILASDDSAPYSEPEQYRRLIGKFLYLGMTRPDATFTVQQLSQFINSPTVNHWKVTIYLLRYLKATASVGLYYSANTDLNITSHSDADWGSCKDTRRSMTGYCVFLGRSLISWKCKRQSTMSKSSAEAKYSSMSSTVSELLWISYLLKDLNLSVQEPILFHCDSNSHSRKSCLP